MRFPEFSGEWKLLSFVNLYKIVKINEVINKNQYLKVGNTPIIDQGNELICGYSNQIGCKLPTIVYGDHTTYCKYIDFEFLVGSDGTKSLRSKNDNLFNLHFLYYCLLKNNLASEGYKRHFPILKTKDFYITTNKLEQTKIANFLSLIDKRIELQNKIIKDYELLKKETKNRIFARLLSCEKRHFLEIFAPFIELNNNDYPQYTIGKQGLLLVPIENQKYNKKHHIVFKENTCIFGIGINEVGVSIDTIGCCSPIYKVYSINDKIIDTYFLQQFINKYLMLNINKITKKSTRREFEIDNSELLKISFNIPNLLVQKRISNIFNKISIYLKLNLEILENLQCLKKYLLTKMFI